MVIAPTFQAAPRGLIATEERVDVPGWLGMQQRTVADPAQSPA